MCSLVVGGLAAGATAQEAAPSRFFPLEAGAEQRFRLHRDRSIQPEGGLALRNFYRGTTVVSVIGRDQAPEGDGSLVRVRQLEVEYQSHLEGGDFAPVRRRDVWVYDQSDDAVGIRSQQREGEVVRYDPPLSFLKGSLDVGTSWTMGTLRAGELRFELAAEVVERGPIDVDGQRFPDALHVRFQGPVAGRVPNDEAMVEVREGRYERSLWLVPGTGPVRERTQVDLSLAPSAGAATRISDVLTRTRELEDADGTPGP